MLTVMLTTVADLYYPNYKAHTKMLIPFVL
jgi:hypothetical protein